ncbi:MAG TPA: SDR family NAD(P)-dependent oxidoreductase [Bryobacteraceae bacterium]|nr:SDR family NAD(P)-dependent oxidoreductase [Bryobacteraceae bacterium]
MADRCALVTGASRGVGRGIAISLSEAGYQVFATGRSIDSADLPVSVTRIRCDHLRDEETAAAFQRVSGEAGALDILVNNAWGGYERMVENGNFTWMLPFWEQPIHRWASMMDAGVRAAFVASSHAARLMVPQRRGLIINISFWAAQKHIGNAIYGVSKAATDKMTADMAHELAPHGVTVVSLYPGLVRTESVMQAAEGGWLDISNSESPEFIGRVIAALAIDPQLQNRTGKVLVTATVAAELGVTDIDGRHPRPLTLDTL